MASTADEGDADDMSTILSKIGLGEYVTVFAENMIGVKEVEMMSDEDFAKLGIATMGGRLRLKQACRNYLKEREMPRPTSVALQFVELQKKRKLRRRSPPAETKATRRVYVGWKHQRLPGTIYKLIQANRGGGQQALDLHRDTDYDGLLNSILELYFPCGVSVAQDLRRDEVTSHVASFSGSKLNTGDFTVGQYFHLVKTNPVRMYLHTHMTETTEMPEPRQISPDTIQELNDNHRLSLRHQEECPSTSLQLPWLHVIEPTPPIVLVPDDDQNVDEEDADLQSAILDSIDTHPDETLKSVLTRWVSRTLTGTHTEPNLIIVQRELVLACTLRVARRATFDPTHEFKVKFSGEDGDDLGGPKREFLRCLMSEVCDDVLHGQDANKTFQHDLTKLATSRYRFAGKLVAFSILHGGPGLPVLNGQLYRLITGREISDIPDLDCVVDVDTRATFIKIRDAESEEIYLEVLNASADFLIDRGLSAFRAYKQQELLQILLKDELLYRVHSEISQFTSGMDEVGGFHKTLIASPDVLQPLFVSADDLLTFTSMRQLYKYEFSPDGSNNRRHENSAVYCFEAFLADCEAGSTAVSLGDVLSFWTGAQCVPPLGFCSTMVVDFVAGDDRQLPSASTCGMVLHLWRGYADADEFARDFTMSIQLGGGFYLA